MSEPIFDSVYRAAPLYFLTPDRGSLVPEVRWFPARNTATYAVRELLEGPSPWLRDAVRTGFPEGTRLAVESVPVDSDGTADVDLTTAVATADADRARAAQGAAAAGPAAAAHPRPRRVDRRGADGRAAGRRARP